MKAARRSYRRMNYVYVLQSLSDPVQFYTGLCHYFERPETAAAFERYLKSGSGREFARRHF